jgi:cardiolipin synthase
LKINLPNALTLLRIFLVPFLVVVLLTKFDGRETVGLLIFLTAVATDFLDGWLARRRGEITTLGALLDPIADKALLASVYVTLGYAGQLPDWIVILVVFRDAMIVGGYLLIQTTANSRQFDPLYISKINTSLQIALVAFVLARLGLGAADGPVTTTLVCAVAATTVLSGASYFMRWARILAGSEQVL